MQVDQQLAARQATDQLPRSCGVPGLDRGPPRHRRLELEARLVHGIQDTREIALVDARDHLPRRPELPALGADLGGHGDDAVRPEHPIVGLAEGGVAHRVDRRPEPREIQVCHDLAVNQSLLRLQARPVGPIVWVGEHAAIRMEVQRYSESVLLARLLQGLRLGLGKGICARELLGTLAVLPSPVQTEVAVQVDPSVVEVDAGAAHRHARRPPVLSHDLIRQPLVG
mmetsp:Transcript_27800/g.83774  ORF Transcript_27800/g.83774 Transcript_27800/m.83774 type:complete len:226 (-) Transcript_27800:532-1209(-)